MSPAEPRELALASVSQAVAALVALTNLAADGERDDSQITVELLADALMLAIEAGAASEADAEDVNQLHGALVKFLEGWVG